jgi:hypothetical protein
MNMVTISKNKIKQDGGVVVLPVKEYKKLLEQAVPTYYLTGNAAKRLDKLVEEGIREYKAGRTRKIKSLTDLE